MAKDKKTFIAYCDWINVFKALEDDEAGRLAKHLFSYVNDEQPEAPDKLTKISFIPIQTTLKNDLKKWENTSMERATVGRSGGLKSGEARRLKAEQNKALNELTKQSEANEAIALKTKQNEHDIDIDIVNEEINIRDSVFNVSFVENKYRSIYLKWINYLNKRGKCYTMQVQFEIFYSNLISYSNKNIEFAKMIVDKAIIKNWNDIYKLDENETIIPQNQNGKTVFKA